MDPRFEHMRSITRRHFLGASALGVGGAALSSLLNRESMGALAEGAPHFAPRAKRVIYLHMAGSPPHLDLLDPKPLLNRLHAQDAPDELIDGQRFAFIKGRPTMLGSPYRFRQSGESGTWVSELMPHFRDVADEVTVIRSMHTDQFNHAPAQLLLLHRLASYARPPSRRRLGRPTASAARVRQPARLRGARAPAVRTPERRQARCGAAASCPTVLARACSAASQRRPGPVSSTSAPRRHVTRASRRRDPRRPESNSTRRVATTRSSAIPRR